MVSNDHIGCPDVRKRPLFTRSVTLLQCVIFSQFYFFHPWKVDDNGGMSKGPRSQLKELPMPKMQQGE